VNRRKRTARDRALRSSPGPTSWQWAILYPRALTHDALHSRAASNIVTAIQSTRDEFLPAAQAERRFRIADAPVPRDRRRRPQRRRQGGRTVTAGPTDFSRLIRTLLDGHVEFILVGDIAGNVHGPARATSDIDVVYDAAERAAPKMTRSAYRRGTGRLRGAILDRLPQVSGNTLGERSVV
jgi:hypothetical protein